MKNESPSAHAEQLAQTFRNGNRKDARDAVIALCRERPAYGAAVVARLTHCLTDRTDDYAVSVFLRMLEDYAATEATEATDDAEHKIEDNTAQPTVHTQVMVDRIAGKRLYFLIAAEGGDTRRMHLSQAAAEALIAGGMPSEG